MLQFGVPSSEEGWNKVRRHSGQGDRLLERAGDIEMKSYCISFFKCLMECLNGNESKKVDP